LEAAVSFIQKSRDKLAGSFAASRPVVLAAAVGAGLYGLAEALRVHLGATFFHGSAITGVLLVVGLSTLLPLGAVAGLILGFPLARLSRSRRLLAGLLAGVLTGLAWDLAVRWFTDPPPGIEGSSLQGNPLIYAGFVLVLLALWCAVVWKVRGLRGASATATVTLLLLSAWVLTAWRPAAERGEPVVGAPNVLWVTIDTIRADHMSTYGGRAETPAFQRVADGGVVFDQAFAQIAVTGPSHTTMLTGTGPWTHESLLNGATIDAELATLPELLRERGYRTAAFVSAYVLDGELGFSRGFDVYDDELGRFEGLGDLVFFRSLAMLRRHLQPDMVVERRGDRTTDKALAWLEGRPEPWFLWVHLFDPHGPYEPPAPFDSAYAQGLQPSVGDATPVLEQYDVAPYLRDSLAGVTSVPWVVAQYDGEISYADSQLGRVLDRLEASGSLERTLVLVNGDHGESFGEHDVWFDHGDDLYDAATWVPLAVKLPGGAHAGGRVADPVELVDLAPTILDVLGVAAPASMQGRTLRDTWQGTGHRIQARGLARDRQANQAARQAGVVDPSYLMASLRAPQSLFVRRESPDHPDEYYDMSEDPRQEMSELDARLGDPDGAQLMGMLRSQSDQLMQGLDRAAPELDATTEEALRQLGYIE
jgi:arylsulfatase A-like enzyme